MTGLFPDKRKEAGSFLSGLFSDPPAVTGRQFFLFRRQANGFSVGYGRFFG